eukprot:CAMPEP_0177752566 /NCGR_PEP_ID=MMETSP0491_2-20121128/989_1 /TAXON_ID=63592 /ORGANISM="Tetraselmis chuii, Strain PLY429" /LENGTH=887 /DNA_ID=CAMNT_0019267781 /DNA_START=95 /DNA_END=2758 /DNA_ORIENTATION=+
MQTSLQGVSVRSTAGLQAHEFSKAARMPSPAFSRRRQGLTVASSQQPDRQASVRCRTATQPVSGAVFGIPKNALLTSESLDMDDGEFDFDAEIRCLEDLVDQLVQAHTLEAKVEAIMKDRRVGAFFLTSSAGIRAMEHIERLPLEDQFVLYLLAVAPEDGDWEKGLQELALVLRKCDTFYDAIGGLIGYQLKVCHIIRDSEKEAEEECAASVEAECASQQFMQPPCVDLSKDQSAATAAAISGLQVLPSMGEIIPLGGAGDRLGLTCDVTGECLPTAVLSYTGRSLLENIVRDVQAREYLYFRVFGRQITTPVAVMTSDAKGNHSRITELLQASAFFGRSPDSFNLFCQPMVPVVSVEDGKWLLPEAFSPLLKPGGHGVIWKLMADNGVFDWMEAAGRKAALVRQISNPLAGTDTTLLALAGTGSKRNHAFGFASCERAVGAAEGMNVLIQETVESVNAAGERVEQQQYGITNVEYTEFERLGITDEASGDGTSTSLYPANTNILYVGLQQAMEQLRKGFVKGGGAVLPGMIFNLNKKVSYTDALTGAERSVRAGRLECTMQNLADCFRTPLDNLPACEGGLDDMLDTFLVYNLRRRTTSSAKRKAKPGATHIHQTPDGSFYDLQRNARDILNMSGMEVAELGTVSEYLASGPGFVFLFHPALGPLWDVIAQKIRGGVLGSRAELVLEVAEADIEDLVVQDGSSMQVIAENVMGHVAHRSSLNGHAARVEVVAGPAGGSQASEGETLLYSDYCGRVRMYNVTVENAGVNWDAEGNLFWMHRLERHEICSVRLAGNAEFEAYDCVIKGEQMFEVPAGHRMVVTQGEGEELNVRLEALTGFSSPSWSWRYSMSPAEDRILLKMQDRRAPHAGIVSAAGLKQVADVDKLA